MFFLARCLFWITLVFVCLPGTGEGGLSNVFRDLASPSVGAVAARRAPTLAAGAADAVAETGAEWCKAHGEACVDLVLTAMAAKHPDARSAGSRSDSLGVVGRVLQWSGKGRG